MKITGHFHLHKRDDGIWYVAHEENGKRQWKTTKCRREPEALAFLNSYTASDTEIKAVVKLSELFAELSNAKTLRTNTLGSYSMAVKRLTAICGDRELSQYSIADLETFKRNQKGSVFFVVSVKPSGKLDLMGLQDLDL